MVYLDAEQHARVSAAVAAAERRSSGEIVTIIADRSDGYTDIALAWAALLSFLVISLLAFFPDAPLDAYASLHGAWNAEWTPGEVFAAAAGIGMFVFLLAVVLQLWAPLKFALVPGIVKSSRAEERAIDLFKVGAERRTHGRTGILIYLSMREHRAEIVADEAIASIVEDEVWGEAMAAMLAELKQGRVADGMIAAVNRVGAVLAEHFPRAENDTNELPDRLIEL